MDLSHGEIFLTTDNYWVLGGFIELLQILLIKVSAIYFFYLFQAHWNLIIFLLLTKGKVRERSGIYFLTISLNQSGLQLKLIYGERLKAPVHFLTCFKTE